MRFRTNAVVAILVLLSLVAGVGDVGVPLNAGLAFGAYVFTIFLLLLSLVALVADATLSVILAKVLHALHLSTLASLAFRIAILAAVASEPLHSIAICVAPSPFMLITFP